MLHEAIPTSPRFVPTAQLRSFLIRAEVSRAYAEANEEITRDEIGQAFTLASPPRRFSQNNEQLTTYVLALFRLAFAFTHFTT